MGTADFPAPRKIPAIQWERQEENKQRINTSLICSIGNNLRGIIKCSQKLRSKEVNNYSNQFSHGKGADNTEYSSFFALLYSFAPRFWLMKVVSAMQSR